MPVQYVRIDYGVSIFQEFVVGSCNQANLRMLNLISNCVVERSGHLLIA